MKCRVVQVTLFPEDAKRAGAVRLAKEDDLDITTAEQAQEYRGAEFVENDSTTKDLHVVYRDGLACVNFIDENGERVNYDYPIHSLKRIKHIASY